MESALEKKIGAIFIPVSDIKKAKDWYCHLLDLPGDCEILYEHIYVISLENGTDIVLDSKIYDKRNRGEAPMFHFNARDIHKAYEELNSKGVEIITPIEHNHWFNFKDPDENVLMVCKC